MKISDEEEQLTNRIVDLATDIRALWLQADQRAITERGLEREPQAGGEDMEERRVESAEEAAEKRGRLWLNDGFCMRLRPQHRNHVWGYDFVTSRTHEGKAFRMLNILDEYARECLNITVERKITSHQVIERLADLFITKGIPGTFAPITGPSSLRRR